MLLHFRMQTPVVGEVVASKFRIDRLLGQGGMGAVFAATHLQLERRVAVKVLLPEFATNPQVNERFLREAKAAARLQGEHVCRALDVGELASGAPFIVMEFLEGTDLKEVLSKQGRLSVDQAVEYVTQACDGLAEAHAAGLVHRDLKPANLFLTKSPSGKTVLKILDFGIAKLGHDGAITELTDTLSVMGTPSYMSPEQLKSSKTVDARSDIWAIGIVLHELLSGVPPFRGDSLTSLLLSITTEEPPRIPEVSGEMQRVVDRCLRKNPAERWATVLALKAALQHRPAPAAKSDPRPEAKPQARPLDYVPFSSLRRERRSPLLVIVPLALLAGIGVLAWKWSQRPSDPPPQLATVPIATPDATEPVPPDVEYGGTWGRKERLALPKRAPAIADATVADAAIDTAIAEPVATTPRPDAQEPVAEPPPVVAREAPAAPPSPPPPRKVRTRIEAADIEKGMAAAAAGIQRCVERVSDAATTIASIQVRPDGSVSGVSLSGPPTTFTTCIERVIKPLAFKQTTDGDTFNYRIGVTGSGRETLKTQQSFDRLSTPPKSR